MSPPYKVVMLALLLSLTSELCYGKSFIDSLGPIHASCKIEWAFGIKCDNVSKKLINQSHAWNGTDCGTSEKCRYKFISFKENVLKLKHVTPQHNYVDDLTFTFTNGSNCSVSGYSTSETWYAVLDYGTNYCNLHNLITGSGLDKVTGYSEKTSNSICTQYSSANCDKY